MRKEKITKEKLLKHLIVMYFIIFPIFDLAFLYNHVTTFIRIAFLLLFVVLTIVFIPTSRKSAKPLFAYYLIVALFLVVNYFHSRGFISLSPNNFNYSIVTEATTLLKLCMPFTVLFIIKNQDFSKKEFFKVINSWVIIISGTIVLFNLCGYSLSSYTGEITNYSIFDWSKNLPVDLGATKGFFMYANQEAIIVILLLILTAYETLCENKKYVISVIIVSLSSVMLGTRISTLGGLLTLLFMELSYVIFSFLFKKPISKSIALLGLVFLGWALLLSITPNNNRMSVIYNCSQCDVGSENVITDKVGSDNNLEIDDYEYFVSNFNSVVFSDAFYKIFYPYKYDKEFWLDIVNMKDRAPSNYRRMELAIINRIWKIDGRWSNYLFGISNSRIQNVVNIEMDFVLQFFAFGIVGMIILIFYYIYSSITVLKTFFKSKKFLDFAILLCLGVMMLASFLSGNSLNFLAVTVPLAFIVSFAGSTFNEN